jgi:hypothetical protein
MNTTKRRKLELAPVTQGVRVSSLYKKLHDLLVKYEKKGYRDIRIEYVESSKHVYTGKSTGCLYVTGEKK